MAKAERIQMLREHILLYTEELRMLLENEHPTREEGKGFAINYTANECTPIMPLPTTRLYSQVLLHSTRWLPTDTIVIRRNPQNVIIPSTMSIVSPLDDRT
jgi:hypothetical protein